MTMDIKDIIQSFQLSPQNEIKSLPNQTSCVTTIMLAVMAANSLNAQWNNATLRF